ncbi:MAG: permease [Lachnospiraceae bacterium]|nr:permease [Lachnospiraceae bacterium]
MLVLKEPAATILTLFAIGAAGYLIGKIHICKISLGTAAIFLSGLVFGHFGAEIPSSVQMTGLTLFITAVGLSAGGTFWERLKQNGVQYVLLCLVIALTGAGLCTVIIKAVGIDTPVAVGMMTGAFTSSPGFGAAKEAVSESVEAVNRVAAGYGIIYPFGAVGKVMFVQMVPKIFKADMVRERRLIAVKPRESGRKPARKRIRIDAMGFFPMALAITGGVVLGAVQIPLPGGRAFSLGLTGGPLLMGLFLGHLGHIGPVSMEADKKMIGPVKELGLLLFFAGAGTEGGKSFVKILQMYGVRLLFFGLLLIFVPLVVGYFFSSKILKLPMLNGLGAMTASMTSTPSLAALIETAGTDDVVAAYATVYPIALVTLVLLMQVLAGL